MEPTRTQTAEVPAGRVAVAVPSLTVIHHGEASFIGATVLVPTRGELVFGRASDGGLPGVFDGGRVSRAHARVARNGVHVEIVDLESRNGTFVDGVRVARAVLAPGALVGIGDVLLRYAVEPPRARTQVEPDPDIAGISPQIAEVLDSVALVAPRDCAVAIIGETGTGKELVARALHRHSGRAGALVSLNCGALPDTLVASELFGHRRGAFTGADRERSGLVAEARGGTLFLDELADASPVLQTTLLRLLEARSFRPVGADQESATDARFVVACQPEIEYRVAAGDFRLDLWSRAARWVIRVPPLRERPDDIPLLATRCARRFTGEPDLVLSLSFVQALLAYHWPGNVRELHSVVERAVIEARGERPVGLPSFVSAFDAGSPAPTPTPSRVEPDRSEIAARTGARRRATPRPAREVLVDALRRHRGNVRLVASELAVMRRTLYRWFDALGIDATSFRGDES